MGATQALSDKHPGMISWKGLLKLENSIAGSVKEKIPDQWQKLHLQEFPIQDILPCKQQSCVDKKKKKKQTVGTF